MLDFLFGWERKVRQLRKRWDRLREKALKKQPALKAQVLQKLDTVASTLVTLEERDTLGRGDRARMLKEVEIDLAEVRALLKEKE